MSAAQPDPPRAPTVDSPQFPPDSYLAGLAGELDLERQRAHQAQRELQQLQLDVRQGRAQAPAWFANVGTDVDRVLEEAGRAAAKLLAEAGRRIQVAIDAAEVQAGERLKLAEEQARQLEQAARATLVDAQTERSRIEVEATTAAGERRAQADRDAKALLAKAHDEAGRALDQAARERQLLEAESQRLATRRQAMVEQLVQVYAPLGLTLVDTRGELQPTAEDGRHAQPDPPDRAAAVDTGPVDGTRSRWPGV